MNPRRFAGQLGMSGELTGYGIAVNGLWPLTGTCSPPYDRLKKVTINLISHY